MLVSQLTWTHNVSTMSDYTPEFNAAATEVKCHSETICSELITFNEYEI